MSTQTIKQNYLQENIEYEPENFETQENKNLDENPDSENYSNDNNTR